MGARMCSLIEKAPEAYQDHLRAQLVAGLFQRFRAHLRQALILGNLLGAPTSSTTSAATSSKKPVEDDFVTAKVSARDYRWPLGARDLHALAPELRQLCTWGLSIGESSSASELDSLFLDNDRPDQHRQPGSSAPAKKKDKRAPADDADLDETAGRDETSLMQNLMDHSDLDDMEELASSDVVDGFNLERRPSTTSMVSMLNSTLGHLWERDMK